MTDLYNREREKKTRKRLRAESPRAERILWSKLRAKQLCDLKFRRQYSVGVYVVDFYCTAAKLTVEIDGETHFNEAAEARDEKRQKYLESLGIRVIRFTNLQVYNDIMMVLDEIARAALERIRTIRGIAVELSPRSANAGAQSFNASDVRPPLLAKEGAGGGRLNGREPFTTASADPPQSPLSKGGGADPPVSPLGKGGGNGAAPRFPTREPPSRPRQ